MEAKFINPVIKSILNVLTTMAKMDPKPGKPSMKGDDKARGDVTGIMSMVSKEVKGSLAISFTEPVALDIAKRMLNQEFTEINDMVIDLTGEIANMVTGGAKALLEKDGYNFEMSLPAVVSGKDHVVTHQSSGPKIILPFTTDSGEFYIEVCFEE